jgi:hypothetical protein
MTIDLNTREQRLRKQAELQYLSGNLANLRERETSYIQASAAVPDLLLNQINDVRREIRRVEDELIALEDESIVTPARQFYWQAFEAELADNLPEALKLYKNSARQTYHDANGAMRSVRYKMKSPRVKSLGRMWTSAPARQSRYQLLIILSLSLFLVLVVVLIASLQFFSAPEVVAVLPTLTDTATPTPPLVVLILPDTPTPTFTPTATFTPVPPTATRQPSIPTVVPTDTPALATPAPPLRPAPRIIDPKNGLTWGDGAIVFEFEELDLASDELYCLNTLRGFDRTNTENWSYPPVGSENPRIPVEANVFRVAKAQGMRCIVWSAAIGKGSCDNIISQRTEERIIGLPQPCRF